MHSLNPVVINVLFNCRRIEIPINNGYEWSPRNSLSHKCRILWIGKTSKRRKYENSY